jgi:curved DNA-binding protein CbpA
MNEFDPSKGLTIEQACEALGIAADADEAAIRAAYLEQVRLHPPDRDPDRFEVIRDAYQRLRDPRIRAERIMFEGRDPRQPLTSIVGGKRVVPFLGPQAWLAVLKEKRA